MWNVFSLVGQINLKTVINIMTQYGFQKVYVRLLGFYEINQLIASKILLHNNIIYRLQ